MTARLGQRSRRREISSVVTVGLSVLASGCVAGRAALIKAPPPLPPTTASTTAPDLSGITLAGAPGRTTTTLLIGPGGATLSGTVNGPAGPVPGAVVHVERLVADGEATQDVVTQPDGTWTLPNILGGRYRVRAYRPPDFAELDAQVFWLGGTETRQLALKVDQFSGVNVAAALAPNPAIVGQPAQLVVQVTTRSVDQQGVVRGVPVVGVSVAISGTGSWSINPNPSVTTGNGRVAYQAVCEQVGDQPLVAIVGGSDNFPLGLPPCVTPPPATTVPETTTTSSVIGPPSSTTSTTRPRSSTTKPGG